jgi:hypothetical protein
LIAEGWDGAYILATIEAGDSRSDRQLRDVHFFERHGGTIPTARSGSGVSTRAERGQRRTDR